MHTFSALIQRRDLICLLQIGLFMGQTGKFVQTHINMEKFGFFFYLLIEKELERISLTKHMHTYNTIITPTIIIPL